MHERINRSIFRHELRPPLKKNQFLGLVRMVGSPEGRLEGFLAITTSKYAIVITFPLDGGNFSLILKKNSVYVYLNIDQGSKSPIIAAAISRYTCLQRVKLVAPMYNLASISRE